MEIDPEEITESELLDIAKTCFLSNDIENSIYYYQRAAILNTSNTFTHSNLGICFFKLENYISSLEECEKALQINPRNMKALILASKCLYNLSISSPSKALIDKAKEMIVQVHAFSVPPNNSEFLEISKEILKKIELMSLYIYDLHRKTITQSLKMYYEEISDENTMKLLSKYLIIKEFRISDALTCPITLDFYNIPCCNSVGHTYEIQYLNNYMKIQGCKDPNTKQPTIPGALHYNKSIKAAVEEFKNKHPWVDDARKNFILTYFK